MEGNRMQDFNNNNSLVSIGGLSLGGGGIAATVEGVYRALAPARYHAAQVEGRKIEFDFLMDASRRMREEFPFYSDRRAVLEALGYRVTNDGAENVSSVLGRAAELVEDGGGEPRDLDPGARDLVINGSAEAYDDRVREMWARLVAGAVTGGARYKRMTARVLEEMDGDDVELFRRFCSMCAGGTDRNGIQQPVVPCVFKDPEGISYNDGRMSYSEVQQLEKLGLVDPHASVSFGPSGALLCVGGRSFRVTDPAGGRIWVSDVTLSLPGEQLAGLCDLGGMPGLLDIARARMPHALFVGES